MRTVWILSVVLVITGLYSCSGSTEPEIFEYGLISTDTTYDTHPQFTASGDTIYFLRCAPDISASTIYCAVKEQGEWGKPFIAPFSGKYFDADPSIAADGQTMYFTSNRPVEDGDAPKADTDIWMMERSGKGWGTPVRLSEGVNSNGNEHYPTVANNGNLYFGSERAGGSGGADIYVSRPDGGMYRSAQRLSDAINTPANEYEPFIDPDERYLIFMATRPDGLKNADFYISYLENGKWAESKKLDKINTAFTEWAPRVSRDGTKLLFGSTRPHTSDSSGYANIYSIPLAGILPEPGGDGK